MAFVLSSSPPPMMPDDLDDGDDEEFMHEEDEDEDSNSYDLTGLSDKLHSIPKEAIQITPKEVVLPNQNGLDLGTVQNSNTVQNDKPPSLEGEQFNIPIVMNEVNTVNEDHLDNTNDEIEKKFKQDVPIDYVEDVKVQAETISNNYDQSHDKNNTEQEGNFFSPNEFKNEEESLPSNEIKDEEEIFPSNELSEERDYFSSNEIVAKITDDKDPGVEIVSTIQEIPSCIEDKFKSFQDEVESDNNIEHSTDSDNSNNMKHEVMSEQVNEIEDDDFDDDFGDFEDAPPKVPPLTLDEDNETENMNEAVEDEDDDFGDFTNNQNVTKNSTSSSTFASAAGWASLDSSPRGKLDQILIGLQLKLATVISSLYLSLESPDEVTDRVQPLDFDREDCEDHIWHLVHNIQSTPALNQKWKDTETRSRLLTFLKIDPKNVSQNEVPISRSTKMSNNNVPAFASGLGVTLEPSKVEIKATVEESVKLPTTSNANSLSAPITNPPQTQAPEILSPSFGASLLPNEEDFKGTSTKSVTKSVKKSRSSAAQTIIDSFPLLDFMQSPILSVQAVKK